MIARVKDAAGVSSVRLRYRSVTQFEDYRTLEMADQGNSLYSAIVPGDHVAPGWDFMYFIEALDNNGNGTIHPDLGSETPYLIVRLTAH